MGANLLYLWGRTGCGGGELVGGELVMGLVILYGRGIRRLLIYNSTQQTGCLFELGASVITENRSRSLPGKSVNRWPESIL